MIKTLAVFLLVSTAVILAACQPSAPTPAPAPTLVSPTAPAPAASWKPDGKISDGEYTGVFKSGEYELHWTNDNESIYIGMKAKTTGWVAMAVQPGSLMKDADMVLGFVKDGQTVIYDLFSPGDFGPHPPDTEQGGKNDILEFGGGEEGGFTTIEFKRALDTGDKYDKPLASGKNKIIWAYGSTDDFTRQHSNRGYGEITLL